MGLCLTAALLEEIYGHCGTGFAVTRGGKQQFRTNLGVCWVVLCPGLAILATELFGFLSFPCAPVGGEQVDAGYW